MAPIIIIMMQKNVRGGSSLGSVRPGSKGSGNMRTGGGLSRFAPLLMLIIFVAVSVFDLAYPGPSGRRYANPPGYVQITDEISTHGFDYYTSPVLTDRYSTRRDHVEAMIATAMTFKGDPYVNRESREPGRGVDCSGLVMQACYGSGVDLWPSNPYRHKYGADRYEWESREIAAMDGLMTVPYEERKRGDLIFYANRKGEVIHVAIYLGHDRIIHSSRILGGVVISPPVYNRKARICMVRRVFI